MADHCVCRARGGDEVDVCGVEVRVGAAGADVPWQRQRAGGVTEPARGRRQREETDVVLHRAGKGRVLPRAGYEVKALAVGEVPGRVVLANAIEAQLEVTCTSPLLQRRRRLRRA